MATDYHIKNPAEWGLRRLVDAAHGIGNLSKVFQLPPEQAALPAINKIGLGDIRIALARGTEDLGAFRTDAFMLAFIYPVAGILLAIIVATQNLIPLLFPLVSGFALVGPIAGIGLYALSRRREMQAEGGQTDEPPRAFGAIAIVALALIAVFVAWIAAAFWIYAVTLGPEAPQSAFEFLQDVFTTSAGWTMIVAGFGVGFLFAIVALSIGVVSFPLMIDRPVGPVTAIRTSIQAVIRNPGAMAVWGAIVAAGLVIGSIPLLVGLIVVIPLLGHSTWHLYRRLMPR